MSHHDKLQPHNAASSLFDSPERLSAESGEEPCNPTLIAAITKLDNFLLQYP